jgi:ribonuclease J
MDNKANVEFVNNKLFSCGAIIYENNPLDLLHASGHACQEDLKLLLTLVSPRYLMPCHGEFYMMKKHAQLATEVGMKPENIFVCKNGQIISSDENRNFFLSIETVNAEPVYILEDTIVPDEQLKNDFGFRDLMGSGGFILVLLFMKEEGFEMPSFFTYGFFNMQKNKKTID